jgi:hypothetical protein
VFSHALSQPIFSKPNKSVSLLPLGIILNKINKKIFRQFSNESFK